MASSVQYFVATAQTPPNPAPWSEAGGSELPFPAWTVAAAEWTAPAAQARASS
jgi:hypothetical protein